MTIAIPTLGELAKKRHPTSSMFHRYPASIGSATLKSGVTCAVPYHNYDGDALILWGSADAEAVARRIEGPWTPVLDAAGRAHVSVWMVDYKETVVGPYKELILAFTVRHRDAPTLTLSQPLQALQRFDDKQALPYVYKLWLDQQVPVDYGRELLGCDKYLDTSMQLDYNDRSVSFAFHHVESERFGAAAGPMLKGTLELRDGIHLGALVNAYGFFRTLGMASGASNAWNVITPPGIMDRPDSDRYNPVWNFVYETQPKFTAARDDDAIELGGELAEIDMKLSLYQHDPHIKAVLLPPFTYVPVS